MTLTQDPDIPTDPRSCFVPQWVWNFLLGFFAPRIASDIGPLILLIFFGCLIFGFFYVWLFVPEVKGLSLEEVDELYRANIKPWKSASWRPASRVSHSHGTGKRRVVHGEIVDDDDDVSDRVDEKSPNGPEPEKAVVDEKRVENA